MTLRLMVTKKPRDEKAVKEEGTVDTMGIKEETMGVKELKGILKQLET